MANNLFPERYQLLQIYFLFLRISGNQTTEVNANHWQSYSFVDYFCDRSSLIMVLVFDKNRVASGVEKNHDLPVNLHCLSYSHVEGIVWVNVVSFTVAQGTNRVEKEINPLNANSMEVGYSSFQCQ